MHSSVDERCGGHQATMRITPTCRIRPGGAPEPFPAAPSPVMVPRVAAPAKADAPYARARGDSADVDVATVEALVSERSRARIAGEYDTADAIRDRLRNEFGVSVDDRVKEWVVDSPVAAPAEPVVDDEPFVVVDAPTEEPAAAAEAAPASGQSEAELSALTVPALKDLCRAAGLKVGGKKAELVERIMRGSN